MYKLVISDDEGKTTVVPLVRDEITIGRKEGNTIRLTERNVSRRHARLTKGNGRFVVEDLGSYNGVRINGERLEGSRALAGGDRVLIGDYVLAVEAEGEDAVPEPEVDLTVEGADEPVPPARLVMLTPPAAGAEFALQKDGMRIGRADELDIWINHKSISREHARIEKDGDRIQIIDLGSANGVRLNGKEIRRSELVSGDIVELGEVQFRFVEKGEPYTFDPSKARAEALASLEAPSRVPLYVALAVLVVALVAAIGIALTGDESPEAPSASSPPSSGVGGGRGAAREERSVDTAEAAAALGRCEASLEAREWQEAAAQADRARALDPHDDSARLCSEAAQAQLGAEARYQEGVRALDSGDFDAAYAALAGLPSYSPRHDAPEVERARRGYVDSHLQLARRALRTDAEEAARQATLLLEVEPLDASTEAEVRRLLAVAGRRASRRTTKAAPAPSAGEASTAEAPALEEPLAAEPAYGLEAARACLRRGDNACVVRALEGHADTPTSLALLIETLRTMGDDATARRHMERFIRRYPTDRRTPTYLDLLAQASP